MEFFVQQDSIVRKIWGKSDTVLFIFAGAAAEFALNKAVDWLFFTGRLPSDPLGRLFSTVSYARQIVFSRVEGAYKAIDTMTAIHKGVENKRKMAIPDWAYLDVLFMLIDYSIRSYELIERKLSEEEKEEVFDVFVRVGARMGLQGLPASFEAWKALRKEHLKKDLERSAFTMSLYAQYKKHLGKVRYALLLEVQALLVPEEVRSLLHFRKSSPLRHAVPVYKISSLIKMDGVIKSLLLPDKYKEEIRALDHHPGE